MSLKFITKVYKPQKTQKNYLSPKILTAENMSEYVFFLTRIFSYNDSILDFVLSQENPGQRKPILWHILCILFYSEATMQQNSHKNLQ